VQVRVAQDASAARAYAALQQVDPTAAAIAVGADARWLKDPERLHDSGDVGD